MKRQVLERLRASKIAERSRKLRKRAERIGGTLAEIDRTKLDAVGMMFPAIPRETTPATITPKIAELCKQVAPGQSPVYVAVDPAAGAMYRKCLPNVAAVIEMNGGTIRTGYCLWEMEGVVLTFERHAVWNIDGELIDITPKPDGERSIVFLPDNELWVGTRTPNIVMPLIDAPVVVAFCEKSCKQATQDNSEGLEAFQAMQELNQWLKNKKGQMQC